MGKRKQNEIPFTPYPTVLQYELNVCSNRAKPQTKHFASRYKHRYNVVHKVSSNGSNEAILLLQAIVNKYRRIPAKQSLQKSTNDNVELPRRTCLVKAIVVNQVSTMESTKAKSLEHDKSIEKLFGISLHFSAFQLSIDVSIHVIQTLLL